MRKYFYLLTALLALAFAGCKSDVTLDDLEFKVANNFFDTYVTLVFENAATGKIIETGAADPLQVSITGPDQSLVVTDAGKRKSQFSSNSGLLPFNLDPYAKVPSVSQPVRLVVTVSGTGFKTVSKQIIITGSGILRIPVALISSANLPDGVTHQKTENFASLTGGQVNATVTEEVPGAGVKLELREGTVLKTASGTPLEGSVSLELTHYDTRAADPSELFPGGISGEFRAAEQTVQTGFLAPGGWIDIEIKDANGHIASQVESKSIGLTLPINPNLYMPEVQRTVQTGDKLKVMSFDEQAARWNYEGEATFSNGSAKIELVHLSTWSVTAATEASNVTIRFTCAEYSDMQSYFSFNFSEATFDIEIKPANGNGMLMNLFQKEGSGSISAPIPAGNYTATFSFRGTNAQSIFKLPDPVNFTIKGSQEVEVVLSMIDRFTVLHGSLSYKKNSASQDAVGGNVNFRLRKPGDSNWRMVTTGQQGEMSIQLEQGDYEVQVNDEGTWKPENGPYTITIPADRLKSFGRAATGMHPLDADFLKNYSSTGTGSTQLTFDQMTSQISIDRTAAAKIAKEISLIMADARLKKDLVRLNCINERYTAIKSLLRNIEQAYVSMTNAINSNDKSMADHEFQRIKTAYIKMLITKTEAINCEGENLRYTGASVVVTFNADPLLFSSDPNSQNSAPNIFDYPQTPPISPLIINTSEGTATISFSLPTMATPSGWTILTQ
jgi:hypothetical protein